MIFKLLSILLRYPDDEVLEHRAEIGDAVRGLPDSPAKNAVVAFLAYWENKPASRLQATYIEAFDFKRRGCLYLSYHRYGDQRARGQVLADMKGAYARAGYPLDTTELPDYLPLVLEFASEVPGEGLTMLAENRAAVEVIRRSLRHDKSPYAHLVEALIFFLPELDEETVAEMQKLIVQGPPQESVGLEPYAADAPPGGRRLGNVVFEGEEALNLWNQFLWVIFPYLSLVTFVLGHIFRYRYDQYGWTPKSSQLLERRLLMWGVLLFHWGFLFVFGGHVMGLLVPIGVYHAIGVSDHNYHLLSLWVGAPVGIVAMIGILLLNFRRWFVPRIRNNTETIKFITDALLLVVIGLGLTATIGYRVYASQYELHGEFEYRDTVGAWFRSLFLFRPDAALMVGAPLVFQLHTLSAFVLFALWPFSSLVHVFSLPLGYLRRSYVQYRSSNPQKTLARERAGKAGKRPAKVEQGSRIE